MPNATVNKEIASWSNDFAIQIMNLRTESWRAPENLFGDLLEICPNAFQLENFKRRIIRRMSPESVQLFEFS